MVKDGINSINLNIVFVVDVGMGGGVSEEVGKLRREVRFRRIEVKIFLFWIKSSLFLLINELFLFFIQFDILIS